MNVTCTRKRSRTFASIVTKSLLCGNSWNVIWTHTPRKLSINAISVTRNIWIKIICESISFGMQRNRRLNVPFARKRISIDRHWRSTTMCTLEIRTSAPAANEHSIDGISRWNVFYAKNWGIKFFIFNFRLNNHMHKIHGMAKLTDNQEDVEQSVS